MQTEDGGLNRPKQDFAAMGAWPASVGLGGTAGAFNRQVYNPGHHSNTGGRSAAQIARDGLGSTSSFTYTQKC